MKKVVIIGAIALLAVVSACKDFKFSKDVKETGDTVQVVTNDTVNVVKDTVITVDTLRD